MPVLPHTGVHAPDPQVSVTALSYLPGIGGGLVAEIRLDGAVVGAVRGRSGRFEAGVLEQHRGAVGAFFAAARLNGACLTEERLAALLIDEYQCAEVVAAADGGAVARLTRDGRLCLLVATAELPRGPAERIRMLEEAGRCGEAGPPGSWELWTGEGWAPLDA